MPPRRLTQQPSRGPTPLPPYEPPYTPLSATQLQRLTTLVDGAGRQTALDKLLKHLSESVNVLGSAAADLGELVPVGKDDHDEDQAQKQGILDELEVCARSVVDASVKANGMKTVLSEVVAEFKEQGREARRRIRAGEEDEMEATRIAGEAEAVLGRYEGGVEGKTMEYEKLGMTAKYGNVAEYVTFRRYLWNAQNPDQGNNMPKPSTWFKHIDPNRRRSQMHADDDSDSDIEIAQAKQSYNCPLTLKRFEHPLTSTICPHSFEKSAIEDYLRSAAGGSAGCPVPGCSQRLDAKTLRPDPVLERECRRAAQRAERRRQEMDDSDGDGDEDEDEDEEMADVDDLSGKVAVKNEKVSKKKVGRGRPMVLDIDQDEDDEDED